MNENIINSVLGNGNQSSLGASPLPLYLIIMDINELLINNEYPGFFRVSINALLSELYPKLYIGVSIRDL